ncbi:MAG: DUF6351 family protein [Euzebya sp.]
MQATSVAAAIALAVAMAIMVAGLPLRAAAQDTATSQGDASDDQSGEVQIRVLSNRADLISGGDALVQIVLPDGVDPAAMAVDADGRDISGDFATRPDGRYLGLVTGLVEGPNVLTARIPGGRGATITIDNHPIGGPVFAGTQLQPWACAAGAVDDQCNRDVAYQFLYMPLDRSGFRAYDPDSPPPDVGQTTTDQGITVPFIIRQEVGSIDRDQYRIAVLYDPSQPWEPWAPQRAWNGKALYIHGGGCGITYGEGTAPAVTNSFGLARGFVVMSTALNHTGHSCNPVVAAESMLMTKEHIIEEYGEIRYSIGLGCSGGSLVQHTIANAYPGAVYDGLIVTCSYPDGWTAMLEAEDCKLLLDYFTDPTRWAPGVVWTDLNQMAATGTITTSVCQSWTALNYHDNWNPSSAEVGCGVGPDDIYDAQSNPDGVRCTLQDHAVAVLGTRAQDGFATRPIDNVGVPYGLVGLQDGLISPAQFVDLNTAIGSHDIDYTWQPDRSVGDPDGMTRAYRSGIINEANNLDTVPIIDLRGPDTAEIHHHFRTWATRARLDRANGHHDNQIIWYGPVPIYGDPDYVAGLPEGQIPFVFEAFDVMDEWLAAMESDSSDAPLPQRVVANKPAGAVDRCIDGVGGDLPVQDCSFPSLLVPPDGSPRMAAGGPLADDIVSCRLKPLVAEDFPVVFNAVEWSRLQEAFPDGVCDYSVAGNGQHDTVPWLTYADGPGGRRLGPAPRSVPFRPDGHAAELYRHGGPGRVETAVAVSQASFSQADTVVLARADQFADALTGAPLADRLDAPLLLSDSAALSAATAMEIQRLGASTVVLLGGQAALSMNVATTLQSAGLQVQRVAGPNRFATAAAVALRMGPTGEVVLASGAAFPDALSASSLGLPILLTSQDELPPETAALITDAVDVTIVGGQAAVGAAVQDVVQQRAAAVIRVAGATRWATSRAVAELALTRGATPAVIWVATGADFPDGLVAGLATRRAMGILLLIDGRDLNGSPETRDMIQSRAPQIIQLHIAGGVAAVTTAVEESLGSVGDG